MQRFDGFSPDNDPYGEHDFGRIELDGESFLFKIDYYADDLQMGNSPYTNKDVRRVLTIMLASDY